MNLTVLLSPAPSTSLENPFTERDTLARSLQTGGRMPDFTGERPLIVEAIRNRTLVLVDYEQSLVRVEPHIYGRDAKGREILFGWAKTTAKQGGWTIEPLDEARSVRPLPGEFLGPRPGYDRDNPQFDVVFARV
jgi:hypothetical protein